MGFCGRYSCLFFPPDGTGAKGFGLTEFCTQDWSLKNPHQNECFPCGLLLSYNAGERCESPLTRVLILKFVSLRPKSHIVQIYCGQLVKSCVKFSVNSVLIGSIPAPLLPGWKRARG